MKARRLETSGRDLLSVIARGFQTGHLRRAAVSVVLGASTLSLALPARATETPAEKAQDSGRKTRTKVRKKVRSVKKDVRDATGNSSVSQDAKDQVNNASDTVGDKAKELKNKAD